jgi:hypothetical protein
MYCSAPLEAVQVRVAVVGVVVAFTVNLPGAASAKLMLESITVSEKAKATRIFNAFFIFLPPERYMLIA